VKPQGSAVLWMKASSTETSPSRSIAIVALP
jgi:hypothetical protein